MTIADVDAFLTGSSQDNDLKQQLRNQSVLRGRSVGLALVYGGDPSCADPTQAYHIADNIYNLLRSLGQEGFAFQRASYYDDLCWIGAQPSQVHIDVYLFLNT